MRKRLVPCFEIQGLLRVSRHTFALLIQKGTLPRYFLNKGVAVFDKNELHPYLKGLGLIRQVSLPQKEKLVLPGDERRSVRKNGPRHREEDGESLRYRV